MQSILQSRSDSLAKMVLFLTFGLPSSITSMVHTAMDFDFELVITNPKAFIKVLANLKRRNIIRPQQLLELAQAQLDFVAQTDETIHPELRDIRLIVEEFKEYDAKLYAKSNSSATQEMAEFDEFDVEEEEKEEEEEEEAKPPTAKKAKTEDDEDTKPPATKEAKKEDSPAGVCAGYSKSLKPSSSAEASTDKVLAGIADYGEKYVSQYGKLDDYDEDD